MAKAMFSSLVDRVGESQRAQMLLSASITSSLNEMHPNLWPAGRASCKESGPLVLHGSLRAYQSDFNKRKQLLSRVTSKILRTSQVD